MKKTQTEKNARGWYSISVVAVRQVATLIGLVIALIVAFLGYQRWERYAVQRGAAQGIEEATELFEKLKTREDYRQVRTDHRVAWDLLDEARAEYEAKYTAERNYPMLMEIYERAIAMHRRQRA